MYLSAPHHMPPQSAKVTLMNSKHIVRNALPPVLGILWMTSLTLLAVGTFMGEVSGEVVRDWAAWLLGPAIVVSMWQLLRCHRARALTRLECVIGTEDDRIERLARAIAGSLREDRDKQDNRPKLVR